MKNEELIRTLAALTGVQDSYHDYRNHPTAVSGESLAAILRARGTDPDDEAALRHAIDNARNGAGDFRVPPVVVWREGTTQSMRLDVPRSLLSETFEWELRTEQGKEFSGQFVPQDNLVNGKEGEHAVVCELTFTERLDAGYHRLSISGPGVPDFDADTLRPVRLIVAPAAAFGGDAENLREWGVSLQLYCLRSARNWGIGDFTDLADLASRLGAAGADFLGVNPLHSLYPSNPEHASPYSPASRGRLNYLYIDVEAVPEFALCEAAREKVAGDYFQARLQDLRSASRVDYSGVAFLKLVILRHLFDYFLAEDLDKGSERSGQFLEFIEQGGAALEQTCVFYALYADHRKASRSGGWRSWPEPLRQPDSAEVAAFAATHRETVRFYKYLQWLADQQLQAAQDAALAAGMRTGLYRDLAVGVDANGADMWRNQNLYCTKAAVGAPPDAIAEQGQNWGLPPMDPAMMQAEGYETFIIDLRDNMRHCGALRLDHVMQLMRLWWAPAGRPSSEGTYVLYPLDDLLGIVALESQRSRCRIVGEDLGIVPKKIREALPRENIWSYKVMLFEKDERGLMTRPADYVARAMATLTTHDLPTLRGYWRGADLLLREELGLFPTTEVKERCWQERIDDRQAIVDALKQQDLYPALLPDEANKIDELPMELLLAMEKFVATSASGMVCVQMEDWMGVADPVNVPGTSQEYANWRRRLPEDYEDLFADGRAMQHAAALDRNAPAQKKSDEAQPAQSTSE